MKKIFTPARINANPVFVRHSLLFSLAVMAFFMEMPRPEAQSIVTSLGASGGWYSDDTRNTSGTDLVGVNLTQYGKPGQTPTAADDIAIAQQLQFVGGPTGSTGGGAVKIIAPTGNSAKSTLSTVNLSGFAPASDLTGGSFSASYRWYMEPNPTARTVAFRIGIQSAQWAASQASFTATRSGEQTWDLILVNVMDSPTANAWNDVSVDKDNGLWYLYGQAGNGNWVGGITGFAPPGGSMQKTLADWASDPTWGSVLFGAGAKITNVQFGLGSSQQLCNAYVDYLQTTLLNSGNAINFAGPVRVYSDMAETTLVNGYSTIQAAINDVTTLDGYVVRVDAGTYTETISVNKNLVIRGANDGIDPNTGSRGAETVLQDGSISIPGANTVTIDGFHIYQTNTTTPVSLGGATVATIQNCIIERFGSAAGSTVRGLEIASGAGLKNIKNNKFTGDTSGGLFGSHKTWNSGMYVNCAGSTINIQDNVFQNCRTALNLDDFVATVTLSGNTFDNNGTHASFGGTVATTGSYTWGANEFKNPGSAFFNLSNVATTFRLDISAGTYLGTAFSALPLATLFNVEAGMYHRGRSSRNGLVYYVANNLYVRSDLNNNIQTAVDYAASGDVVNLMDGTYNQTVTIGKSLTLDGQSKAGVILDGTGITAPVSGILLGNNVTDVTIQDLTVQNFAGGSGNTHAGIYAPANNNNLTIDNVAVQNNTNASGIYANGPIDNVSVTNCMVTNHNPITGARGIVIWNGLKTNITMTGNTVTNNSCCGIELQDGDASAVNISNNTIDIGTGDNAIGVVGLNPSIGANTINNNIITGGGRYGIEIKNPAGGVTVNGNNVTLNSQNANEKDRAGIAILRRGVSGSNVDVPNGVAITGNTVDGYQQTSTSEGFGIVVEGTSHMVTGNTVKNCEVGIIQQQNPSNYPGNADDSNVADQFFGRGNSPATCGNTISGNTFSGNTTDMRNNPAGLATIGNVFNINTSTTYCSIQSAIDATATVSGNILAVAAATYTENVNAAAGGKNITLAPGASPGCVTIAGNMTLNSGDVLDMEVNSATACTGYDQFTVNGTVTLGGATLNLTVGYTVGATDVITLILNDAADAVVGQFAQGNYITVSGVDYYINYAGGTGNDVVLSRICGDVCGGTINITSATVTLSTQSQVNAFKNGSGCKYTKITGNLILDGNGNAATGAAPGDANGLDPITDLCNLQELVEVTGSVTIRDFSVAGNPTTLADLANLATIGNALTVGATAANDGNTQFTNITLGNLTSVGGALTVRNNTAAAAISLAALNSSSVASVLIQDNAAATSITCGNGFIVDGTSVSISNNAALTSLTLNAASVATSVTLSNNDGTGLAVSGSLGAVGTSLTIQNCAGLASVSFPNLISIGGPIDATGGNLTITDNATAVTSISLPLLQTIDGIIDMSNAASDLCTPTLNFSDLTEVDGSINITRSAGGAVSFPDLTTVRGTITFGTNFNGVAGMTSLSLAALTHNDIGAIDITENDVMTSVTLGSTFSTGAGDDITIDNNDVLAGIVLNATTAGGIVTLSNNDGANLMVSGSLGDVTEGLNIQNCATLKSVSFPSLTRVGGDPEAAPAGSLTINTNGTILETVSLPALESIDGNIAMANTTAGNYTAAKLTFTALERIDGNIDISHAAGKGMAANGDLDFPALATVEGTITVDLNNDALFTGLSALNLGALVSTAVDAIIIDDNDAMTSLTLGVAGGFSMSANSDLTITDHDALTTLTANVSVSDVVNINNNLVLTSLVLNHLASTNDVNLNNNDGANLAISGSLASVGRDFSIQNCAALLSVSFPSLTSIGGAIDATDGGFTMQENGTVLDFVNLPLLATIDGVLDMSNTAAGDVSSTADISLDALTQIAGTTNFTRAASSISAPLLTTIDGSLTISTNSALTTLAGFESLTTIGTTGANELMTVTNNPMLGICCIIPCQLTSIDGNVTHPFTGDLTMSGNLTDCNSHALAATACGVSGLSFTVTEDSGIDDNDNEICDGATVNLEASVTANSGTITFEFFIDADDDGTYNAGDALIASIDDATSPYLVNTTYSTFVDGEKVAVKASNAGDLCSETSSTVEITVYENPLINTIGVSAVSPCTGGATVLDADVTGGTPAYNYMWAQTAGPGVGAFDPNTNDTDPIDFIGTTAGSVTVEVTVTDANGCVDVENTTFNVSGGGSCDGGTYVGNVQLDGQIEVDAFLNGGCKYKHITGNLVLVGNDGDGDPITNLCNLNELLTITGSLTIRDFNNNLNPLTLDDLYKLQQVGDGVGTDNVTIGGAAGDANPSFVEIELVALQLVGNGSVTISNNPNVVEIELVALQLVGTDININNNGGLETVTVGNGSLTVGRDLLLQNNDAVNLTNVTFNATTVTRNLTLDNDDSDAGVTINLPVLTAVNGTLTITDIAGGTLDLDVLTTIGAAAAISSNGYLTAIEFEQLANTAAVTINANDILASIDEDAAGNAITATGSFTVSNNPQLTSVVVNDLASVTGSVDITTNAGLQTVNFPGLATVSVDVIVDGAQSNLQTISIGNNATVITRNFTISANDATGLTTINANVASVGGALLFDNDNEGVGTTVNLLYLTAVGNVTDPSNMTISQIATGTLNIPLLQTVSGTLTITDNDDNLTDITLPALTAIGNYGAMTGDMLITNNNFLEEINTTGSNFSVGRNLTVTGNNNGAPSIVGGLATLNFDGLTGVGRDLLFDNDNRNLSGAVASCPDLTEVKNDLSIRDIANQIQLTATGLDVLGDVTIDNNDPLCDLDLSGLTTVSGFLTITNNGPDCTGTPLADVSALTTIGDYLNVEANTGLGALSFDALMAVNGDDGTRSIDIVNNDHTAFTSVSFPLLNTATTLDFRVNGNANLATISAPALPSVGDELRLEDNNMVSSIDFSALTAVNGAMVIDDEDLLTDLSGLDALMTIGGNFTINGNGALTSTDGLDALTTVGGTMSITANPLLTTCCIVPCQIATINGSVFPFTGNLTITGSKTYATGGRCINNGVIATAPEVAQTACSPVGMNLTIMPDVCSDDVTGHTLSASSPAPLSVPADHYNITMIDDGGLTASAGNPMTGTDFPDSEIADDAWTNTTNATVNVVYTVVPVSAEGCEGTAFTVTVPVKPEPLQSDLIAMACSDQAIGTQLPADDDDGLGITLYDVSSVVDVDLTPHGANASMPVNGTTLTSLIANDQYNNITNAGQDVVYTVVPYTDGCVGMPFDITVTINPEPIVANQTAMVCSDESLTGFTLGNDANTPAVTSWNITMIDVALGLVAGGGNTPTGVTGDDQVLNGDVWTNTTTGSLDVVYTITPKSADGCEGNPFTITVTVKPEPILTVPTAPTICSDAPLSSNWSGFVSSNGVGINTLDYNSVTLQSPLTANGGNASIPILGQSPNYIDNDAFTNLSNGGKDVTYNLTPISAQGCAGDAVNYVFRIFAEPQMLPDNVTVCSDEDSGVDFTLAPGSFGTTTPGPNEIKFKIVNINIQLGLTPDAGNAVAGDCQTFGVISDDSWTNLTNGPLTVTYTVRPQRGCPIGSPGQDCDGDDVTITVTVNPEPVFTGDLDVTVCSDEVSGVTLPDLDDDNGDITSFDISAVVSPNLTGTATTGLGITSLIAIESDDFNNVTNASHDVVYTVTPYFGDCAGTPFMITVTVKPEPVVLDKTGMACSDAPIGTTLPATDDDGLAITTYDVSVSVDPDLTAAGTNVSLPVSGTSNTNLIAADKYTNLTNTDQDVVYTVTPYSDGCEGTPFDITVTIKPEPVFTGNLDVTVCSGELTGVVLPDLDNDGGDITKFDITATVNPNLTGAATQGMGITNLNALAADDFVNTTNDPHVVIYYVTPYFGNCAGTQFTITVTVNPEPDITCPGPITVYTDDENDYDCTVSVELDHPEVNTDCPTILTIAFSNGSPAPASLPTGGTVTPGGSTSYEFAKGETVVTYTAIDDNSNQDDCNFTVTVIDNTDPTIDCPDPMFANISQPSGSCEAIVTNIDALFDDNCPGATLAYELSGATTASGNGQASGETFERGTTTVTYTVTDATGNNTEECSFNITIDCIIISGKLIWEQDDVTGVGNATVKLTGDATDTDVTPASGLYTVIANTDGSNFVVKPHKNVNLLNGLSVADATRVQQHVNLSSPFTDPYDVIAADVNHDEIINSGDASLINQVLLGNPIALLQFDTSWRFVRSDHTFPAGPYTPPTAGFWTYPQNRTYTGVMTDQINQDFIGVKIGDLVSAPVANPANHPEALQSPLVLIALDQVLQEGQEMTVEFRSYNFSDIAALQFALRFDEEQLDLVDISTTKVSPLTTANFGTYNAAQGELRAVWSDATKGHKVTDGQTIFRIRFRALAGGSKLSELLRLNPKVLACEAYHPDLTSMDIQLKFIEMAPVVVKPRNVEEEQPAVVLLQNQPNPFVDKTTIGFILGEDTEAHLRIFDVTGRLITERTKFYQAGYHAEEFQMDSDVEKGLMYYELTTPKGHWSRKMISVDKN